MKTEFAKKDNVDRKWYVVDAKDQVLGRIATKIATYLRGKHKPIFTPNSDTGDFIVVINADKVRVTGNKVTDKIYYWNTGYPMGLRAETLKERSEKYPERILASAVKGMLPKTRLGRAMFKKFKVYNGTEHPHQAQKPEVLSI